MANDIYLSVLDPEVSGVFLYEVKGSEIKNAVSADNGLDDFYLEYMASKGHNISNIQWLVCDNFRMESNDLLISKKL